MRMIFQQTEEFKMDEPAPHPKCFQAGASCGFQIFGNLIHDIEADAFVDINAVHNRNRGNIACLEQDAPAAVYDRVVRTDLPRYKFFHDIWYGREITVEGFEILLILDLPGVGSAYSAVRLYDDRISHFPDKSHGFIQSSDHMVTRAGDAGAPVSLFHPGFMFYKRHVFGLQAGGDMEIFPQAGVLFQPVFIVALKPVYFPVMERQKGHCPKHFIVIFHIVYPVIFGQSILKPG